jgi:hypothetical protein
MKKEFNNLLNLINYGKDQDIPFLFITNKKLLLSIDDLMNQSDFKSAIANMGDLSENMLDEYGEKVLALPMESKKGVAKKLSFIISTLIRKQLFELLPYDVEIKIRFIAFNRNYSSHGARTDQTLCQAKICYEYFHDVINWFLLAANHSKEYLPDFKLMSDSQIKINDDNTYLLPALKTDKKFNYLLPNDHQIYHDSIIYDFLIKQESMEVIRGKYFPDVSDPNVVYAVLKGIYGIDRAWKRLFKDVLSDEEKLSLLISSTKSLKEKTIHRALNRLKK